MRLTLINQFYKPDISPTARLATSLAEHRAALGDQVTIVASRGGYVGRGGGEEALGNPRIRRVWTPQFGKSTPLRRLVDWTTFYLLAFWRVFTLPRQDVILSLTTPPYIAWAAVFHKLIHRNARVILWNMDCYPDVLEQTGHVRPGGWLSRSLRLITRLLFRNLDALICLDSAMSNLLLRQYSSGRRPLPCRVIPNWEPADEYSNDRVASIQWTADAARGKSKFTVLYMGNAGYGHEFATILDAAEALRDQPITFLFVGGGARRAFIDEQRQSRRLDNIVAEDYVPEEQKQAVLAGADCALITLADFSLGIMSPSKLHANLAMGLPILYIGPAASNVDDAIRRFGCGASFRNGDAAGVIAFLDKVRMDDDYRKELRRRARQAFDQAYCDTQTLPMFDAAITAC